VRRIRKNGNRETRFSNREDTKCRASSADAEKERFGEA
jgi:hypothetical protein